MHVADVLAKKGSRISTVDHERPLRDAIQIMHDEQIGAIVVVNGSSGIAIGIVSQSEVFAALHDMGPSALKHCATGVMRRPPPQCSGSATIQQAMGQMTRDRARHLLVMDGNGVLAGIVSMGDLVAARVGAAELEANVLRDMARSHMLAGTR